jgi:CheY-like chemotaxis protein
MSTRSYEAGTQEAPGRSPVVMVVEDDEQVREFLVYALELEGYRVVVARNGREAIDRLHTNRDPSLMLILLDLMMPVMDGWQFRTLQRGEATLAAIPVVVVSAAGWLPERVALLGANGYLEKPIDLDQLLAAVHRHCDASPAGSY